MNSKRTKPAGLHEPDPHELLSLAQAARILPRLRRGKPIHPTTLWRWSTVGLRGVRLIVVQVGGTKCTTRTLLDEFFHGVGERITPPPNRGRAARKRAHRQDVRYLRTSA